MRSHQTECRGNQSLRCDQLEISVLVQEGGRAQEVSRITYGRQNRKDVDDPKPETSIKGYIVMERGNSPVQRPIVPSGNGLVKDIAKHIFLVHDKAGTLAKISQDERRINKATERELFEGVREEPDCGK
jgi:hypothetical protein